MPEFDTICVLFTTLKMKPFMCRDIIHSTTQTTGTLHKNTQKHYHNQHIPTQPHLNYTHTHTKTLKFYFEQNYWSPATAPNLIEVVRHQIKTNKFQYMNVEPSRLPMTNVLVQSFNFQIQTQQHYNTKGGLIDSQNYREI